KDECIAFPDYMERQTANSIASSEQNTEMGWLKYERIAQSVAPDRIGRKTLPKRGESL
ncbi:hypothetical protein FRC20_008799, partial [Serendipita sp. 405]